MAEKLSWEEIQQRYNGEWVELVDYEWLEGEPYPKAARIHAHAQSRKDFNKCCVENRFPGEAARLFVGRAMRTANSIFSCNAVKIIPR